MAELIHIRGADFRGYRKFSVDLSGKGLFLVAGPTNAGKSALLSALDVVAGGEFKDSVRHSQGFRAHITTRWSLSSLERGLLIGKSTEAEDLLADPETAHWMEWVFSEHDGFIRPTQVAIQWRGEERIIAHLHSPSPGSFEFSVADFPLTNEDHDLTRRTQGGGSHPPSDTLHFFQGYANGIPHNVLTEWRKGYFHFRPLRESAGRRVQITNVSPRLEANGENLATVLLHLYTNEPETWRTLQDQVTSIVPDVGQLMVPVQNTSVEVVFKDSSSGVRHNLKDLGSGVEQLLMLLVVGLTESANVVVLEEPETGLHASAQRAMLTLLQTWSADRLFMASTHSAALLDWHSPTTSVLAVSRKDGESVATLVTTERAALLQELGVRLSDVLSAERILIVEGPTDKEILDTWFPAVLNNPRVVIIRGGGGYNARHAGLFASWLDEADGLGQRRVLYVRDRDELSAEFLSKLEASENVYVLPCRELENLVLDPRAIQTVINAERERLSMEAVSLEDIATATRELADKLQQVVVLKQVMADLADPIRLVDNSLRSKLAKASADKDVLSAEVVARVPTAATIEAKISSTWEQHAGEISSNWDSDWKNLAPGADVLQGLWLKYLNRGYGKSKDGLALAEAMEQPPQVLQELLDKFMQENE
ncbi:AAA family ATPase [Streptomyces scabiei]|uniref:AAA family ATPase n=1 Tax=Streptomyces scabiei TaxID=1930 RepID=UPI001B32B281|nr:MULTISPECIES: AAA family ATPase [Streptomyces]MBP5895228.1 AAA family ATPase [Streptomyces sp. LBUM 1481]MBP5925507.1 AAA family ATPase [Streptomyces sp. LBUM 1483]MDX2684083.1 AAA family ATPase [Streptomyces scabiei]MDX2748882.1 AAA family ATPase [Streptomyces scabiei]MDX2803071.1 AAA family ATPase [Streptomyces scabiei]